ncbi:IDEAL domain-containing protein [Cerasibacillus terrae]|uniref:IDEAL domain-containing protein n=1 Tax=Cerasibacillus terrae TaxID=2498845 RepID=A0A5C8NTI4_9BACI|nr:IDEAL domain-containing protein [Cerasibacillus terrae]TXL63973.1 IDEAL domain-containing protein [Cerasibacillus terrae]
MNKEKVVYRFKRHQGKVIQAKREVSYEIMLTSRLILDELCFQWNKEQLVDAINESIEKKDHEAFKKYSEAYRQFVWE